MIGVGLSSFESSFGLSQGLKANSQFSNFSKINPNGTHPEVLL
jgi:hypothetical protein